MQFVFTDMLSLVFTFLVIIIVRQVEGLFEDQKHYLIRLNQKNEDLDGDYQSANEHNVIPLSVNNGQEIVLSWIAGDYPQECSWVITDPNGIIISEVAAGGASNFVTGDVIATFTVNCAPPTPPTCEAPVLTVDEVTITSASLSPRTSCARIREISR